MKRFNEYLNEDFDTASYNHDGGISIDDPSVVEAINASLEVSTACTFRTPYNGLEEVRKVLSYYKIFLPKSVFLDKTDGNDVFQISQFGEKMGMNNDGEVVKAPASSLFVYFEWSLGEDGMYDIFAAVVDDDELDEIMADFQAETEINESAMPDLKKKMGTRKVTLPNMMRKEDYDSDEAEMARHAKKFFDSPSRVIASNARKIHKKHNDQAVTGMKKEEAEKKLAENWGDRPPKSEREGYSKDPKDGKWKPTHKIGKKVKTEKK